MSKELKPHQTLLEMRNLVKSMINQMTNDSYAQGDKVAYRINWEKGETEIENNLGKKTKNYYTLSIIALDKRNSTVGETIPVYTNHYSMDNVRTVFQIEEIAYKELLLNGLRSLNNVSIAIYYKTRDNAAVEAKNVQIDEKWEEIKKSAEKPKLFVP